MLEAQVTSSSWGGRGPCDAFTTSLVCRGRGNTGPNWKGTLGGECQPGELVVLAFVGREQWALSSAEPECQMTDQNSCQPLTQVIRGHLASSHLHTVPYSRSWVRTCQIAQCEALQQTRLNAMFTDLFYIYIILPHTLKFPCKP